MATGGRTVRRSGVEMLPAHLLLETGPFDHGAWNCKPVLGWQQRQRFRLIARLIGDRHFGEILEIGYGSGVFAPELVQHCDRYVGLDVHQKNTEVAAVLGSVGIEADLRVGSASAMPIPDDSVDGVVGVSVLEFVDDIVATCEEISRVLRPDGRAFLTVTGDSPILDLALRIITGESADKDFADRRAHLEQTVRNTLVAERTLRFPRIAVLGIQVYQAFSMKPSPE